MFEDQSQKFVNLILDRINNFFSRKPLISNLLISSCISSLLIFMSFDYRRGETEVEISDSVTSASDPQIVTEVKADLSGAVRNPGIYSLSAGDRLWDLISLGGGLIDDVSSLWVSKNLNLSHIVEDGEKIYIPFEWDIGSAGGREAVKALRLGVMSASEQSNLLAQELESMRIGFDDTEGQSTTSSSKKINVNTATLSELDTLPGVGPTYAEKILDNRPYLTEEDFKIKSGLSEKLANSLLGLIDF